MRYQIASDNQFKDDVEVLMMALTPQEVSNYKDRKVEPADIPGWYKVYRAIEYPNSWALTNQFPDPEAAVPSQASDFWIAHCLMQGPKGKRNGRCRTYELMGDVVLEFSVSDYNLTVLDEVRDFIRNKVTGWKQ